MFVSNQNLTTLQHMFYYFYIPRSQHSIQKIEATYDLVNSVGVVSSSDITSAIRPGQTFLFTLMLSNKKSVSLQPVANVAARFRELQVIFHTDVAQEFVKVPVNLRGDLVEADMVTLVDHTFGPPKGVAALYVQPGCLAERGRQETGLYWSAGSLILGGGQEGGGRAATENVPYIVGLGRAA